MNIWPLTKLSVNSTLSDGTNPAIVIYVNNFIKKFCPAYEIAAREACVPRTSSKL